MGFIRVYQRDAVVTLMPTLEYAANRPYGTVVTPYGHRIEELDSGRLALLASRCPDPWGCVSTLSLLDSSGTRLMDIGVTEDSVAPEIVSVAAARVKGLLWDPFDS
jgi:hypothetical protein